MLREAIGIGVGIGVALTGVVMLVQWRWFGRRLPSVRAGAPSAFVPGAFRNALEIDDFYIAPRPGVRYGFGKPGLQPLVALFESGTSRYRDTLSGFIPLIPELRAIGRNPDPARPAAPAWVNGFLPGLDTIALYGMAATLKPRLYLEIGSGNSTRVVAAARQLHSPTTRIVSIDPQPRAEIDALCDQIMRAPLEEVDLAVFDDLRSGDILFFDGSHRVLQNSDVSVFFLEVLPRLASGVHVHVHDILLPNDYPSDWTERYYSEQYILATLLIFGAGMFEVVLPNRYITDYTRLADAFAPIWDDPALAGVERHGASFWMRKT